MSSDIALINAYEQLEQALSELRLLLSDQRVIFQLFTPDTSETINLSHLLTQIWYTQEGDGRRTLNQYGLVGVPPSFIPLLQQINQKKLFFKQAIQDYREQNKEPGPFLFKRACELNLGLSKAGLARLHLKQCYRTLPILESCPDKVTFSWYTSGKSQKKLSVKQALERLMKMDTGQIHIQMQIEALNKLSESEPLVQIQNQVPVMRANIAWRNGTDWVRKARNCPLPLFFPMSEDKPFPEYNTPALTPPEKRSRQFRADSVIETDPYLPSLRVHRYKK